MKNPKLFFKAELILFLAALLILPGCYYTFHFVNQPFTANPNSSFEVEVSMGWYDDYERADPTDHCFIVKLPEGWTINDSILVNDTTIQQAYFLYSQSLTDSINQNYPATENYQWQVFQLSFDLEAALAKYKSTDDYEDSLFFKPIINTDSKNGNFWLDYHLGYSYEVIEGYYNSSSTNHLITIGLPDTILVTNTNDDGPGSLRAAIDSANGETIRFDLQKGATIVLESQLDIEKGIIIEGLGSEDLSISGDSSCRVFHIHPYQCLFVSGLNIRNGYAEGDYGGSAILVDTSAKLTANNLIVTNNKDLGWYGGTIYCNYESNVELDNVIFKHNTSLLGACVVSDYSILKIQNSMVKENEGIGICINNSPVFSGAYLKNVSIVDNSRSGVSFSGIPPVFDSIHRCNIYLNNKDLVAYNNNNTIEVYVDTFTVLYPHKYHLSPVEAFDMHILNGMLDQVDADLYVSPDGDNANTGLSVNEPLKNIRIAYSKMMDNASNPHNINLLEGVYSPSSNEEQFPITIFDYTSLKGAGPENTILDSEGHGSVIRISGELKPIIEGITITGGNNSGIYCNNSNPHMTNILVTGNSSSISGGGMAFFSSAPILKNLTVSGNTVTSNYGSIYGGGGIYFDHSNPVLSNVNVTGNNASGNNLKGGGIYFNNSNSVLNNTVISENELIGSNASGGGVYCDNSNSIFINALIANNLAPYGHGGGMYCVDSDPVLINSTFTDNVVHVGSGHGGGLACVYNSNPVLINTIMWNDLPDEILFSPINEENSISISYSNIQGGESGIVAGLHGSVNWLEGNINQDPVFVGSGNHHYQINDNSPCIDAGTSDTTGLNLPVFDLAGEIRYVNNRVDMGAYEWNLMVSVEDLFNEETINYELTLFPNPVDSNITLIWDSEGQKTGNIHIYNTSGNCVRNLRLNSQQPDQQRFILNIADLPSGIYFVNLKTDNEILIRKIVKL